jgi:hypothetical protein
VSWDEFISFMLCQDQGASIIAEESGRAQYVACAVCACAALMFACRFQLPVQMEPAMRCTGHEDSIVRVMVSCCHGHTASKTASTTASTARSCVGCAVTPAFCQVLDGATDRYLSWTNDGQSFLWQTNAEPPKAPAPLNFELPFVTDVARVEAVG